MKSHFLINGFFTINHILGYLDTLKLNYNANDELTESIKIHQTGLDIITTTTQYYYDAFGRRIAKTSHTKKQTKLVNNNPSNKKTSKLTQPKTTQNTTLMLWDGNRQAQEYTDTHVFTTVYDQDSFEPVARLVWLKPSLLEASNDDVYTNKPNTPNNPIQIYHYHNDHLGTPNELTNNQGEVVWLADYEAWGNTAKVIWHEVELQQIQIAKDELQPIRFQGQTIDQETGLHYNRFRYYDPDVGMFISRDPIELDGGFNIFQYAPNPVMWIDPFGLKSTNYRDKFWERVGQSHRSKYQVHHIFPQELYKSRPQIARILNCAGMGKDDFSNLIGLPKNPNDNPRQDNAWFGKSKHNSNHKVYTDAVAGAISRIGNSKGSCAKKKAKLMALQQMLRRKLNQGEVIMNLGGNGATTQQWNNIVRGY